MANGISKILSAVIKDEARKPTEAEQLIEDIRDTVQWIDLLEGAFELQSDPDLVEAFIYEISAKRAKYRYLLGRARALGVCLDNDGAEFKKAANQ